MIFLQVYVSQDCWSCRETAQIIAEVAAQFPNVRVEVLDAAVTPFPDNVFAVPTYLLNGRVISMGNPTRQELRDKLLREQQKTMPDSAM